MLKERKRAFLWKVLLVAVVVASLCGGAVPAFADPIPRILLAGDSWTGFLLAFRSFKNVLPEYPGLERWIEVGNRTAEMGARAFEMIARNYQQVLTEELTKYPNVDVVVMTLGGNDILRGTIGVDPNNYYREVELEDCYRYPNDPWSNSTECIDWLALSVKENVGILVDHILSVRPDIRVIILSYDYGARRPDGSYTVEEMHTSFVAVQERMRELALERDRVEFVMNFGLMQNTYGIPTGDYPADGFPPADIPPGVAPYPCDAPDDPECTFWPGGFPQYLSPMSSYIDHDIHLTADGYACVARRAIEKHIEEWLNYPKALEILPLSNKATYQFQVTFSHPVTGVGVDDFEIYINTKSGLKAMNVVSVDPASGPADIYTVTVDMGSSQEAAQIKVLDDDSIIRADTGVALGGPGAGNGLFVYNGTYEFQDIPLAADDDFEGSFQFLYMASQAYEHLLAEYGFSFNPEFFDANGDFTRDGSLEDPYVIPGNGLLDLYEFMVLDAILKRPDLDFSANGGISYAVAKNAWDNNITTVQAALGGVGGLADIILPGLDTLLAGFQTIGDKDSNFLVTTLVTLLGAIDEFPTNLDPSALPYYDSVSPDPTLFLRQWLSWSGDADKDGVINDKEYAYFAPDGLVSYVNAVLDPSLVPSTGEGSYKTGDFVRIPVLDRPKSNSTFQWFRNGVPIANEKEGRITGANARALTISSLEVGDAGAYTCNYTRWYPTTYQQTTYGPINITVRDVSGMPVGGLVTLSMLVLTFGAGGVLVVRKKR